jgi:DNA/RNA endonuclease YhcR with UshA esterase domain
MRRVAFASIVLLLVAVTGCACEPGPAATTRPLPTAATAAPTSAPTATPTPFPTDTPAPTDTPTRAATSAPTDTPTRAATPTPAATATPAVVLTPIGDITAARAGEELTVEAQVVGAESFSAGFKFTLDDGTGEINLGARVRATGEVGEYEGEMQIVPGFGGDVKAIEGAGPWAAPRDIGTLSGSDAGQRVMIEGSVIRVEGGETWAKIFVGDDTGEVVVFIWRNVLDRIPNNTGLGVEGTRVRVFGLVEIYRDNLQVMPALPYDVIVLE